MSCVAIPCVCNYYRLPRYLLVSHVHRLILIQVQEGRLIFNAYLGAVFTEHGLQTVQEWIGGLLRLSTTILNDSHDMDVDMASTTSKQSTPAPTFKRVKVEEPSAPPLALSSFLPPPVYQPSQQSRYQMHQLLPQLPPPRTNLPQLPAHNHYNPYFRPSPLSMTRPPSPPRISPPNPLAPAQPHLSFLPLFNQTANQRGLSVSYPAVLVGPPHAGKWSVGCVGEHLQRHRISWHSFNNRKHD
jgi:hypothetical protein